MSEPILYTENLAIGYPNRKEPPIVVADKIGVGLQPGELVCLLGPNGAGKSTLMRTLARMQVPLHGGIFLNQQNLNHLTARQLARQLSVVLTEPINAGMLTGWDLVALGRHPYTNWAGQLTAADETAVNQAIAAVGATSLAQRHIHTLSDGERQKIMIARALAQEPTVMLLDEPTAYLDLPRRVEVMHILRQLARDSHRAILLSTHDLDLALRNADKIWLLPKGGSLQVGTPEELVLNGSFEAAFQADGVQFDRQSGSFKMATQQAGQVDLVGEGLSAVWTKRALERVGFAVHEGVNGATMRVQVLANEGEVADGRIQWQLIKPQQTITHRNLTDLVNDLKQSKASAKNR
ncbi:ABC transporter ATP-binding protein [Candidatus Leptofilum sp.]|uniref:ABC transporter ATP-binding protein n=1 Tax=Candidatus Leptofilum sp. TaxID=3241576 RepID=UPI003B59264B